MRFTIEFYTALTWTTWEFGVGFYGKNEVSPFEMAVFFGPFNLGVMIGSPKPPTKKNFLENDSMDDWKPGTTFAGGGLNPQSIPKYFLKNYGRPHYVLVESMFPGRDGKGPDVTYKRIKND